MPCQPCALTPVSLSLAGPLPTFGQERARTKMTGKDYFFSFHSPFRASELGEGLGVRALRFQLMLFHVMKVRDISGELNT